MCLNRDAGYAQGRFAPQFMPAGLQGRLRYSTRLRRHPGTTAAGNGEGEFAKCQTRIRRLEEMGFELRRPETDYLRDGIYELRATHRRMPYRILYFFHDQKAAVLSNLITKEGKDPDSEIDRSSLHKLKFEADPETHTFRI
ncbi:MAG: type II toxin-antitoxin system RelE/ParE family toxin [Gemmatimonadota bacterium]